MDPIAGNIRAMKGTKKEGKFVSPSFFSWDLLLEQEVCKIAITTQEVIIT